MIIDAHTHLNDSKLFVDIENIIKRAKEVGVNKIIVSGYDKESSYKAIEIANTYDIVFSSIGIHPSEVNKFETDDLLWLEECLKEPKVVAIGEIGLDYYWDKTFKDKQIEYFEKQIEIALKYDYPIIIHSRSAAEDTYNIVKDKGARGVMHCYAYSYELAQQFIKSGYLIGIGGVVTFKNAGLKEIVSKLDLKDIMTETDAPYLAPIPFRGKTNEPMYTLYVVEEIARIKEVSRETVEKAVEDNAMKMFQFERDNYEKNI